MTRLKYVAELIAGQSPASQDVDILGEGLPFLQGNAEFEESSPVPRYECSAPPKRCQMGDLLLSVRAPVGAVNIADRAYGIGRGLCAIYPRDVVPNYLRWWLHHARPQLEERATGSTFAAVSTATVGDLILPDIPQARQRAIADYLDRETARIDTLVEEQQRLIEMLRERRASIILLALTPSATWERRRIKRLGDASLGKMLDAGRAAREGDELKPYVRAADVRSDGSVNLIDLNEMPFSNAEMETFALHAGDVLLIEGGATVGRPGFMWESAPGIAFQKTVNRLRVDRHTDPRFVYWSMLRLYESSYYPNHYGAVSFVHLTGEKLREIELDLPSLPEQRDIAVHLDEQTAKIDELTAETERFIDLSRERRSALITAAVTGQIDVREEVVL